MAEALNFLQAHVCRQQDAYCRRLRHALAVPMWPDSFGPYRLTSQLIPG
jgi:hypothetical protein